MSKWGEGNTEAPKNEEPRKDESGGEAWKAGITEG
jgi:hypothetical protein